MIIVDTTVLVYAVGDEHPLRRPCRDLIETIAEGRLAATTTVEVIQELAHVRARRRSRRDAASLAADYAVLFTPLIAPDLDDLREGLRLFEASTSLGAIDAVLGAMAIRRGAAALVSADRAFATIDGIRHVDPAQPSFVEILEELTREG